MMNDIAQQPSQQLSDGQRHVASPTRLQCAASITSRKCSNNRNVVDEMASSPHKISTRRGQRGVANGSLRRNVVRGFTSLLQGKVNRLAMSRGNNRNRGKPHHNTDDLNRGQRLTKKDHRGPSRDERTETANH